MVKSGGHELVHAYISKTLLDQAIARAKFTMTRQEIEKAVSAQFEKMPEELRKMLVTQLSAQKKTLQQYISELAANPAMREQIIIESFARKNIIKGAKATEADAKKYYDANKAQFTVPADTPETLRASHILIAVKEGTDGKAELKKAQDIYARVKKTPADFGKIAYEKSTCPSGKQAQGSLGAFQKGQMVPEFEKAVLALKPGEISQPVKTQFGWHIIRRDALRKAEVKPYAAVKDDLVTMLTQQKEQELFVKYMENLEKAAKAKNLVPQPAPNMMVPGAK
ncbi:MAG: peptidylprolyl isomerase [Lentisphaeria bacterium]|nr:peptidylprolyl isomerase [Lentisphaeria bacterium]